MTRRKLVSVTSPWRPPWNSLNADCPRPGGRSSPWRDTRVRRNAAVTRDAKFCRGICWLGWDDHEKRINSRIVKWQLAERRRIYETRWRTRGKYTTASNVIWRRLRDEARGLTLTFGGKSTCGRSDLRTMYTSSVYTGATRWNSASNLEHDELMIFITAISPRITMMTLLSLKGGV